MPRKIYPVYIERLFQSGNKNRTVKGSLGVPFLSFKGEPMREYLDCCGILQSTADEKNTIDCYKSKRFFKKFTSIDKKEIKKEILLVSFCRNCNHYILKYLWYIRKGAGFFDYVESKIIRGEKADKIFEERINDLTLYPFPKEKQKPNIKHSKTVPWIYGKVIDGERQVPRYIDESDNAGRKIYSPVKIEKI